MSNTRLSHLGCFCFSLSVLAPAQPALAQASAMPLEAKSPWMVGFYVGALSEQPFITIPTQPWTVRLENSFIGALNLTYVVHEFESLPISFEIDGVLAKRFGNDNEAEVALLPMARWKAFPWNSLLYTNLRLGLSGPSYVSDVSPWELKNSGNRTGSRFLNFLVPELTVSSGPGAPWEAFLRVHHRSGAWGTINGVYGGSNYISVGYRQRL
jgi:hypothetical protein